VSYDGLEFSDDPDHDADTGSFEEEFLRIIGNWTNFADNSIRRRRTLTNFLTLTTN